MPGVVFHGVGSVWDPGRSRILCRFDSDGRYETSDRREIDILITQGYPHEGVVQQKAISIAVIDDVVELADDDAAPRRGKGGRRA